MPILQFPTDRIVGVLEWDGSWSETRGPVLATGAVGVPDGLAVGLDARIVLGSDFDGHGAWSLDLGPDPIDLDFLQDLPADSVESLTLHCVVEASFGAVAHLSSGLRRLCLAGGGLTDVVLATVAELTGLTWLQTFGNAFTDSGAQQLATLVNLVDLYLEEDTLTVAAFAFVDHLPGLDQLGVQDVRLDDAELRRLRDRLSPVRIVT